MEGESHGILLLLQILKGEVLAEARTISSRETASITQYGNRKCGTHARVVSQTVEHGNSKNEIRQRKKKVRREA